MILSIFSNTTVEEVAAAATQPLWFQLYVQPDRDFTAALVRRVEAAGCQALVVSVDTPVLGPRFRETRIKFGSAAWLGAGQPERAGHRPGRPAAVGARHL